MGRAVVKVLLAEDTASDAELLEIALRRHSPGQFVITRAQTLSEAIKRLQGEPFDVLLLDMNLPDSRGTGTFIRAREEAPRIPIVVLTGIEDESVAIEAARQGIEDYIVKGTTDGRQLSKSIRYAIERAHAAATVSGYKELVRTIVESVADPVFAKDLEGRYILVNQATATAFNRSLAEFLGHKDTELFPSESAQALNKKDLEIVTLGKDSSFEESFAFPEGNQKTFVTTKGPLRDGFGKIIGVFGISHEITRAKQTEKHLQGIAGLLKLFAMGSSRRDYLEEVVKLVQEWCGCRSVGIRLLKPDQHLPFAAQLGYSQSFLRQENKLCVANGECACMRVLTGHLQPEDATCTSPNGSLFCNHVQAGAGHLCPVRENGAIPCIKAGFESLAHIPLRYRDHLIGSLHLADPQQHKFPPPTIAFLEAAALVIAEAIHRLRIEESLVESEVRFRTMFQQHASVMLLVDPKNGKIVDANSAAAAFYGCSQDQLRAMKLQTLHQIPPNALRRENGQVPEQRSFNILTRTQDNGQDRIVEAHSSTLQVQGKRLLFFIIHDITERMRLQNQVLEIGEQERKRLGQDLHDSLGGKLAGAALMSKALAQKLASSHLPEAKLAQEVVACINDSIRQTRAIARGLWPAELTGSGLSEALAEVAAETERRSGIRCTFQGDRDLKFKKPLVALNLFRLALEAVNNAVRHAEPQHVAIELKSSQKHIKLEVRDDGKGLPPKLPSKTGMGLRTMRYRAESIGARLQIHPAPPRGTIVSCLLPQEATSAKHRL